MNDTPSVIIPRSSNYPFDTAYIPPAEQDRINKQLEVTPEVSIILPCYNAHNTLKRTLSSIAMQENLHEIEVIIADDCSDIPYDHICEQFAHMMQIRIVRMLKNGGPGAARQVGFDHSRGKYVMWMDADDTLVSADTISTLKNVLIQKDMDCVYGKFLEQNEDGSIYPHEVHMVWMFGKLYRRSFLEKYNIRFNTSLSNEDTGFNCLVKGCSERIWYLPKDVYIWHFKANSITRIRQGMYGQDSGYKGYLDNMIWQILELQKRFINKNYILNEIISVYCTLYHFHVENMQRYPMNTEISLNWIRGYYELVMKPYEQYITESLLLQTFANVAAGQNIAAKGIIPTITFQDFDKLVRSKPMIIDPSHEICGATPAGHIPPITSPDWPVEIKDYFDRVEGPIVVDSDTNKSRYGGMKRALGIAMDETDYQPEYVGEKAPKAPIEETRKWTAPIEPNDYPFTVGPNDVPVEPVWPNQDDHSTGKAPKDPCYIATATKNIDCYNTYTASTSTSSAEQSEPGAFTEIYNNDEKCPDCTSTGCDHCVK